jgi:nucleoside-diphosphate-sugar epimerase
MKVLIIGGTGVISTSIVDRLCEQKHDVTVFNRGLRPVRYKHAVAVIHGDKNAPDYAAKVSGGFDAVIDMISHKKEDAAITLDAFKGQDAHFVFTSTVAVYKRPYRGVPIVETHDLFDTDIFPYGYHKARMEDYLRERMAEGLKITIIRPSLTYGIGCKNIGVMRNNYGIVERIKNNKPVIMFGDGTNPWAYTFAHDLAKAYAGVLRRDVCYGQTYHATSDDVRIWDDLYIEFGKIIGVKPTILHVSTEMLHHAAPDTFTHVLMEKMHAGVFDNSKIKKDVPEFVCEYTLDKLLSKIYDWYMSDPDARVVNSELDLLEDSLVDKYYKCMDVFKN